MNNDEQQETTLPAAADATNGLVPHSPLAILWAVVARAVAALCPDLAKETAGADNSSKEGTVSEQESGKTTRLQNGAWIEAERGWDFLHRLRTLLEDEPQHFQTLLALARSDAGNVDGQSVRYLIGHVFLRRDGSLEPGLRDVLLSGYRETVSGEGPVMANPFQPADTHEALTLESEEDERREARWSKLVERIREEEDQGRGHERP